MKNTILLIVFILLGSCSSNNDPTYRILRVENDKQLETNNKMLKKNYALMFSFGETKDAKYMHLLYQKFSTVSNIVYLPQNEFYKDSMDFEKIFWGIMIPIIKSSDTITTSALFNDINKNQPNSLVRKPVDNMNVYIPVYSPVFYQEILSMIGIMIDSEFKYDLSKYHFKKIPVKDIVTYNEDKEVNIKKLENDLNDIYTKENLLFLTIGEDGFTFIEEE